MNARGRAVPCGRQLRARPEPVRPALETHNSPCGLKQCVSPLRGRSGAALRFPRASPCDRPSPSRPRGGDARARGRLARAGAAEVRSDRTPTMCTGWSVGSLTGRTVLVTRAPGQAGEFSAVAARARRRGRRSADHRDRPAAVVGGSRPRHRPAPRLRLADPDEHERRRLVFPAACASAAAISPASTACASAPSARRPATTIERAGLDVAFQPSVYRAEGLINEAGAGAWQGKRVLFPRAAEGRDVIPDEMRRVGAELDLVTVYRTVPSPAGREQLHALLAAGTLDALTFTSGSTVKSFVVASRFRAGRAHRRAGRRGLHRSGDRGCSAGGGPAGGRAGKGGDDAGARGRAGRVFRGKPGLTATRNSL